MRIRLTLWSLLCFLLTGQALQANAQDVVAVGAQITSESSIVSGKAYVLQYLATGTPYITENNGQYSLPNSQNQATEASTYYLISNGDGTWKIKNYYSGKCWGVPVYNTALAAADESAAGTWSLNFSGGIAYPSAPDADGTVRGIDRSSQKMLGHGTGTGITKRIKIFEVPLSTTALSELISHDISIASEAAATVETGQWYVMSQRTRSSYVYEDVTTHTLKHTQTKPSGKATTNASYLVQLVSGTDGNYYIKNGLGNYIGQIIASTNVPTTALKEEQHAVQKINNTDGHYSVQCISNSVVLNANDFTLGDPATVVGWETTAPAATGSNNDWAFYPVELIPTASEVYTLNNTNNNRGALVYNGTSNNVALVASANLNASNANHQWVLYPTATDGQYYLYNVGAGKFAIPTSIAQDDQNAWVFSNNAVAVTLLNQGNGKFRIKMATNPVNGTNAAVLGVNINRTPAVFNYNDAGSDFAFTLVEGANASTQVEAAVGKLVDNQTALSAVPASGTNSWYVIRIKTHGTFSNRYVYPAATEQTYNNTNYPLTFDHDIDIRPAINEVKYFTRISNTNNKVYWQMPNGKYLYGDENKFPISTLTEKTFSMAYSDNGFYMWGSSRYAVPYYLGSKYFIGETSSVNAYYDIYPIDLEDAGLVPWKVNISENPSDRQVTCARNDVSGLTAVYNNGYFFLPDDVTPSASDFTTASYNGKTPDFVIDTENHLITVNYLFTSDKVYTITNTNEGATRGSLIYNPDNTKWVWASGKSGTFDASQANSQWVFIPTGTANQYYLYNVGAGKFAIPMKGGTYGNGNSYSWGFSDNAVAIKLIQQSDGSFKMYSVTHNVVISISTNYTGPVIFFDDNGAKFNISLVDGQNQSAAATAAANKLYNNRTDTKLTAAPASDGWYAIKIQSKTGQAGYANNFLYTLATEYNNSGTYYPLAHASEVKLCPSISDATYYFKITPRAGNYDWQMPNGKYLVKPSAETFPVSSTSKNTIGISLNSGGFRFTAGSLYADAYDNFIGETTYVNRTLYDIYPVDLEAAGLTEWKVTISEGEEGAQIICSRSDASGLTTVYTEGFFFLPTGATPDASDFTVAGDGEYNHRISINASKHTITAIRIQETVQVTTKEGLTTGWYLLKMATGTHADKYILNNSNEQNYNTDRYPLTYQADASTPDDDNALYYVRIIHDDTSADNVQMQAANGHYLSNLAKAATSPNNIALTVSNEKFLFGGFKPYNNGDNRILGRSNGDTSTSFEAYNVSPLSQGLIAWQVTITGSTISDYMTCSNENVVGLTKVYNNGYIFLPDGIVPTESDFTWSLTTPTILVVDDDNYTITLKPAIESYAVLAGHQSTGVGNTNAVMERIKLGVNTDDVKLTKAYITLKDATKDKISRLAVYQTRTNQFNPSVGENDLTLLGQTSDISKSTIELTLDEVTLTQGYYLWLAVDVKDDATLISSTIGAAVTSFDYKKGDDATTYSYTISSDPNGRATIFKTQSFVFVPSNTDAEYYRIPAIAIDNAGGIVAFSDLRHISTEDIGKSPTHTIDVVARRSTDSGKTWGAATYVAQVNAGTQGDNFGYGDAAVVKAANGNLIAMLAGGTTSFQSGMQHLYLTKSTDNGVTWSTPTDIFNDASKLNKNGLSISSIFTTSGSGLCTSNGHLMFVAVTKHQGYGTNYNHILESSDNGDTWQLKPAVAYTGSDESKVIERLDGSLLMSVRSAGYGAAAYRGFNVSTDMGETWGTQYQNPTIWGNGSDHDIIYYSGASAEYPKGVMLHTMCNNGGRQKLTLYISLDGGETWALAYEIQKGLAAYTCMKVLADGSLGILFEDGSLRDKGDEYAINFLTLSSSQMTSLISKAKDMLALETNSTYKIKNYGNNKFISKNAEENTNNVLMTTTESDAATFILIPSKLQAGFYYLYDTQSGYFLTADNSTTGVSARWTYSTSTPTAFMIRESDAMSTLYTLGAISAASNSDTGNYLGNYDQGYPNRNDNHWYIVKAAENAVVDITAVTSNIESFVNSAAAAGTQLQYTAKVGSAARGTVVIPFEADVTGDVEAYTLTAVDGNSNLQGTKVETIEANKPVLLKNSGTLVLTAKEGTLEYADAPVNGLLHGVYTSTQAPVGSYVLQKQGDVVAFFHVEDIQPMVEAFRAYLTVEGNARMLTINFDGETTGINSIDNGQLIMDNGAVYDLQGRKVNLELTKGGETLPRGLYIINGKKVVIK